MAKKTDEEKEAAKAMRSQVSSIFEGMKALNPFGSVLSKSTLSTIDEWTDTGSYALNAIVSGSCFRGIQNGRVIGFAGPSGCGKTLMCMKIAAHHLKRDPENRVVVFDSEIAVDAETAINLGADPERVHHYPVSTVSDTRNQVLKLLQNIANAGLQRKIMIIIDSLGNLAGSKEVSDAEKGKDAADMGLRAKELKGFLRVITIPAAIAKTTVLFTNHTYADPAAMYASAVENQSGGKGPIYLASLLVQLGFRREKTEDDFADEEMLAIAKKVGGISMRALTVKNRFIPPMLETEIYLNFKTGLDRYSGLFEMAKSMGVIEGNISYTCNGENIGRRKSFERNPEVWDKIILPVLDEKIKKEFVFSSSADEFKAQLDELDESDELDELNKDPSIQPFPYTPIIGYTEGNTPDNEPNADNQKAESGLG